ncbi:hypothetical protein [Pseudaquabacterium rugosum]|jgi:hypothetical protein|uniref:Uncharacterized protein n=1 Tax=Pseudaquabacterium rugosum TaxID=2984194 RepID=A0ABU9B576_9BURK
MEGVATRYHAADGVVAIERAQDCTPIAEHCAALRQAGATGGADMRHAASLPAVVVERYINDKGITFAEFLRDPEHARTMLNDPALAAFRVWEGKA